MSEEDHNQVVKPTHQRIYDVVRQVPAGKVTTYGQVARIAGGCTPRMVGFALASSGSNEKDVPWQRVINAQGKISPHGYGIGSQVQRELLESEGVAFDERDRVDFEIYGWLGPDSI